MTMRMMLIMALGLTVLITHARAQCESEFTNAFVLYGVMAPECSANITNRYVICGTCHVASNPFGTNILTPVPITLSTYAITNSDGSLYDTGVNISFKAWPTNAVYELQWAENLTSNVWFGYGLTCWPTNWNACYSGPIRSSKCPARFFRVMSGSGECY